MKKIGPPAKTVTTVEELSAVEAEGNVILVGYFADLTGTSAALTAFTEACRGLEIPCAQTSVAAVAKAAGTSQDSVAVVTKFKVPFFFIFGGLCEDVSDSYSKTTRLFIGSRASNCLS
jgi:hypothetical protein